MSYASWSFKELRFVLDPELTQVYVHLEVYGDAPIDVQGWHHKTFPASLTVEGILFRMFNTTEDNKMDNPIMWPQKAP